LGSTRAAATDVSSDELRERERGFGIAARDETRSAIAYGCDEGLGLGAECIPFLEAPGLLLER
jgi:hypothetical protein